MNEVHISLDLETLDVDPSPNAGIIAVGAVSFTRDQIIDQAEWILDPMLTPGSRSQSTWNWWCEQEFGVRHRMFGGNLKPWEFCPMFSSFIGLNGGKYLWGYPARFDCGHLRQLFRAMEQPFPLDFRAERDLTTLRQVLKAQGFESQLEQIKEARTKHDALSDALAQAKQIQLGLEVFGIK